jgi:hypothetical protein
MSEYINDLKSFFIKLRLTYFNDYHYVKREDTPLYCYICKNYTIKVGGYCTKYNFHTQPFYKCDQFKLL